MGIPYHVFHKSEVGHNHIKAAKVCEDWAGSYQDDKINICVVADGHGSDNYPRTYRGSKFAVQAAMNCTREFLVQVSAEEVFGNQQEEILMQLEKSILSTWHSLVEEDFVNDKFNMREIEKASEKYKNRYLARTHIDKAYGTTLIIFAVTKEYSVGIQIGDGTCVVLDDRGNFSTPIPADSDCHLNVTTSICDSDAINEFRYYVSQRAPIAVFCGTDGIEDSYSSMEEVYALYRSVCSIFAEYGAKIGEQEVIDYLPVLTRKGSGDDVSIAAIVNMNSITSMKPLFELQSNLFRVEEELETKKHQFQISQEILEKLKKKSLTFDGRDKSYQFKHEMGDEFTEKRDEIVSINAEIEVLVRKKANLEEIINNFFDNLSIVDEQEVCEVVVEENNNLTCIPTEETTSVETNKTDSIEIDIDEAMGRDSKEESGLIELEKNANIDNDLVSVAEVEKELENFNEDNATITENDPIIKKVDDIGY